MWASMIRLLGGKGERAGVATAMAAEERLQQRRSAVARVNGAIETAASRMTQLEEDFLAFKQHGTYHAERHTEGAVRCAKMEAIMMDVEDGVLELRNKAIQLSTDIGAIEEAVGAEALMRGREVYQIQRFNSGKPSSDRSSAAQHLTRPEAIAASSPAGAKPRSFQSSLEEFVMTKMAL